MVRASLKKTRTRNPFEHPIEKAPHAIVRWFESNRLLLWRRRLVAKDVSLSRKIQIHGFPTRVLTTFERLAVEAQHAPECWFESNRLDDRGVAKWYRHGLFCKGRQNLDGFHTQALTLFSASRRSSPTRKNKLGSNPFPSTCGWAASGRQFARKANVSPWLVHSDARRFTGRLRTL